MNGDLSFSESAMMDRMKRRKIQGPLRERKSWSVQCTFSTNPGLPMSTLVLEEKKLRRSLDFLLTDWTAKYVIS